MVAENQEPQALKLAEPGIAAPMALRPYSAISAREFVLKDGSYGAAVVVEDSFGPIGYLAFTAKEIEALGHDLKEFAKTIRNLNQEKHP